MLSETNEQKILNVFFSYPTDKFHLRELARRTKLHPNTVSNVIKSLTKEKILKIDKKEFIVEISVNRTDKFKQLKKLHNLKSLYNSGLLEKIKETLHPEGISILGSYSTGEDLEESDLDLVIISNEKENISLEKYEKILNRKIHLIVVDYNSLSDEFYTNLINGIVLDGFIRKK
jgi:predicted nucleotidyltransferase